MSDFNLEPVTFSDLIFAPHPSDPDDGIRATHIFGHNGYGASVIKTPFSYGGGEGKYELAVLHSGKVCCDTDITNDVLGWLDEQGVTDVLARIAALPERQ